MRQRRVPVIFVALVVLALAALACAGEDGGAAPGRRPPTSTFATRVPRPTVTPGEEPAAATPASLGPALSTLSAALAGTDAHALEPLLVDGVLLVPEDDLSAAQTLTRTGAVDWLAAHWGDVRTVTASDFAPDTQQFFVTTRGWLAVAPLVDGRVVFRLQEVDQPDVWRIDALTYR